MPPTVNSAPKGHRGVELYNRSDHNTLTTEIEYDIFLHSRKG